jgi:hypothetical protein
MPWVLGFPDLFASAAAGLTRVFTVGAPGAGTAGLLDLEAATGAVLVGADGIEAFAFFSETTGTFAAACTSADVDAPLASPDRPLCAIATDSPLTNNIVPAAASESASTTVRRLSVCRRISRSMMPAAREAAFSRS